MKKRTLKVLACATMMAMTLSVTACGSDDAAAETAEVAEEAEATEAEAEVEEEATETEAEVEEEATEAEAEVEEKATEAEAEVEEKATEAEEAAEEVEEEVEEETETASGEATTLEEYYNDPTVKSILDSAYESMSEEGMSVALEVKENTMTVIIKLEDDTYMVDGIGDMLQSALEEQASTFEEQVAEFDEVVGESGACTVVMRYLDPDDNVLAEQSYTAK